MCFISMLCLVAICMRLATCVYFFGSDLYMLNVSAESARTEGTFKWL